MDNVELIPHEHPFAPFGAITLYTLGGGEGMSIVAAMVTSAISKKKRVVNTWSGRWKGDRKPGLELRDR